ncbi:hypothetical protein HDU93_005743 [Gonapodya sp. JEL0774]|nr:hypothetical protein HDU93_005743 [Gonapodya sp. JEL0774]
MPALIRTIHADPTTDLCCLTNAARAAQGLPPMGISGTLASSAEFHSSDQASMGSTSHFGSDGSNPLTRIGNLGTQISENVAGGFNDPFTVFSAWMDSPGHRAAIMGPFNCQGSAMVNGFFTQDFAFEPSGCPIPSCGGVARRSHPRDFASSAVAKDVNAASATEGAKTVSTAAPARNIGTVWISEGLLDLD